MLLIDQQRSGITSLLTLGIKQMDFISCQAPKNKINGMVPPFSLLRKCTTKMRKMALLIKP